MGATLTERHATALHPYRLREVRPVSIQRFNNRTVPPSTVLIDTYRMECIISGKTKDYWTRTFDEALVFRVLRPPKMEVVNAPIQLRSISAFEVFNFQVQMRRQVFTGFYLNFELSLPGFVFKWADEGIR